MADKEPKIEEGVEEEEEEEEEEEAASPPAAAAPGGEVIRNAPHDEALAVEGEDVASPAPSKGGGDFEATDLKNLPHDAALAVDDSRTVTTPEAGARRPSNTGSAGGRAATGSDSPGHGGESLANQPHDLAVSVKSAGGVSTPPEFAKRTTGGAKGAAAGVAASTDSSVAPLPKPERPLGGGLGAGADKKGDGQSLRPMLSALPGGGEEEDDGKSASAGNSPMKQERTIRVYDPEEFASLNVPKDVRDIFSFITAYQAIPVELEARLRPFIPDYIPAVGDIDAFIKVPRPDGRPDDLGLLVLDEPAMRQSNPAIVGIELAYTERAAVATPFVPSVEDAMKHPLVIDKWVREIDEVHKVRPPPSVSYSKPMPDVDSLMQVWPAEIEDMLGADDACIPPAEIDLNILQYTHLACSLLDVPVYQNPIESLHLLFTLYADFKANVHFQAGAFAAGPGGAGPSPAAGAGPTSMGGGRGGGGGGGGADVLSL